MKLEVKQLENGDWILYLLDENGQKIKARIIHSDSITEDDVWG